MEILKRIFKLGYSFKTIANVKFIRWLQEIKVVMQRSRVLQHLVRAEELGCRAFGPSSHEIN